MPREIVKKPRFIYPQIATSLSIAEVSALAELLFWRILPQADDQGRLPGEPRQLKATACPLRDEMTPQKITELLSELEKADVIICYSNSTQHYIQIKKWWDYQSAMRRIFPSHYPPPQGWQDRIKDVSGGQPPTNADKRRPEEEEEEEKEPETETRIQEEEVGTPTTAASVLSDKEQEVLTKLRCLKHWRTTPDDVEWLQQFQREFPEFGLGAVTACADYHSGRLPPKHKGQWKNRLRNWMLNELKFERDKGQIRKEVKGVRIES